MYLAIFKLAYVGGHENWRHCTHLTNRAGSSARRAIPLTTRLPYRPSRLIFSLWRGRFNITLERNEMTSQYASDTSGMDNMCRRTAHDPCLRQMIDVWKYSWITTIRSHFRVAEYRPMLQRMSLLARDLRIRLSKIYVMYTRQLEAVVSMKTGCWWLQRLHEDA